MYEVRQIVNQSKYEFIVQLINSQPLNLKAIIAETLNLIMLPGSFEPDRIASRVLFTVHNLRF